MLLTVVDRGCDAVHHVVDSTSPQQNEPPTRTRPGFVEPTLQAPLETAPSQAGRCKATAEINLLGVRQDG